MSSSAKFPDWQAFSDRELPELPFDVAADLLSPAMEVSAALQRSSQALLDAQQEAQARQDAAISALAQQAIFVFALSNALERAENSQAQSFEKRNYRSLRIIKDQMLSALSDFGLVIENPLGKAYHEVANSVEILGWRHHSDFTAEVVAEVREPIIIFAGRLVRSGSVIMGAPPLTEAEEEHV
jgi:molecular chaperone GrpE (heat shock protein)